MQASLSRKLLLSMLILGTSSSGHCSGLSDLLKQATSKLPDLPASVSMPKNPDGVSTSLDDAHADDHFMDGFDPDPSEKRSLDLQDGKLSIRNGFYDLRVQSYCLRAGTHRPKPEGTGFLLAPLKGPRAGAIGSILSRSALHPDIKQTDVQLLIWAILSGAKINKMSPQQLELARRLLTDEQLKEMISPMDLIPESVRMSALDRLNSKIPDSYKSIVGAYSEMKNRLESGAGTFQELERLAVLDGDAPAETGKRVKERQWMLRDGGYFVRVIPQGYQTTHLQIYRPLKPTLRKDASGFVTSIVSDQ